MNKTHKMTMSQEACHHFVQPIKKPQDDDEPFSLSSSFAIEEKNTKDELGGLSSSFVNIKHVVGSSSMPTHGGKP
jgi:hypothetical protein